MRDRHRQPQGQTCQGCRSARVGHEINSTRWYHVVCLLTIYYLTSAEGVTSIHFTVPHEHEHEGCDCDCLDAIHPLLNIYHQSTKNKNNNNQIQLYVFYVKICNSAYQLYISYTYKHIYIYIGQSLILQIDRQIEMDINKLKSRLNLKFEPIQSHRKSLKKIAQAEQQTKPKIQQHSTINANRSRANSQLKLPTLSNRSRQHRLQTLQSSTMPLNMSQLRERARSYKDLPRVKAQSKESINSTITYLMKNQILNVPRIIALLQKNQSDQFIYMRMVGIYQYEACEEKDKGNNYITVSKNGMVHQGELTTLETLAREFQLYGKLKKIQYFKSYHYIRYLYRWKQENKRVRFEKNRDNLSKQLHLKDQKLMQWRIQIFGMFNITGEGGWIHDNWIHRVCDGLTQMKEVCVRKLVEICYKMLENFDLPISESIDLLNRVVGNLVTLNITFQKKIRIQKQCEKFYKLGRQLQLNAMQRTAAFVLTHLRALISKISSANNTYNTLILERLQYLDINKEQYSQQRLKILSDSLASMDVDYTLYYDSEDNVLGIKPTPRDIFSQCVTQIGEFMKAVDRMGFRMLRTDDFKFIIKNVFKSGQLNDESQGEQHLSTFKNFVTSMPKFQALTRQLQYCLAQCQKSFQHRLQLMKPFLYLLQQYLESYNTTEQFNYESIQIKNQKIQEDLEFCQKLDQGQYFIIGFLKTNEFKKQLISQIKRHQQKLMKAIPVELAAKKTVLLSSFNKHFTVLNKRDSTALGFIQNCQEIDIIEENLLDYIAGIEEIERIQQFYQKNFRNKLNVLQDQKKMLNQIRSRMKNFQDSRQSNFTKYRKSLEYEKQSFTKKIHLYSEKDSQFYNPFSQPKKTHSRLWQILQNLKQIENELGQLNKLQAYFNLKPTSFSSLDMLIKQYEGLEQIWRYANQAIQDANTLNRKYVKDIIEQKYIKFYEQYRKKSEKYVKDTDLTSITQHSLQLTNHLLNNLETIQLINQPHLRVSDLQQINYLIDRKNQSNHNSTGQRQFMQLAIGNVKCRNLTYEDFNQMKVSQLRENITEIVFKAKKQIQINQNLQQFNQWWKSVRLEHEQMQDYPHVVIFGQNLKIRDQIDEYMTMLINILNNKYGSIVRNQVNQLLKKMNSFIELLQLTEIHQQKFLNLFPILTSKYAEVQLSAECKKFDSILSKTMKNTKLLIKPTENLSENTRSILNTHIKHFDTISAILSKFLQSKRLKFQRFYFLQDYELLEVLVGIADEKNVFRMFEGVKGWLTDQNGIKVGVQGVGGQNLVLRGWNYKNVEPQVIFKTLQQAIKANLNSIVRNVLYHYEVQMKQLRDLYEQIPWMCLYTVELALYTKQVQLNCFHDSISLASQQSLLRESITKTKVRPLHFSNYITLTLFLLHFTQQMRRENVYSIFDFQWHSFLRFYFEKDSVVMRALGNEIKWGGEYQGLWSLMVNTSDIRRAHICVLNNLQYANGVLLQGPSGTGKTESLKQLARCTGKYCVIFNCSQNVNLKTISKLLSGLCYTASWLCLDEINRLTIQAMSTIAKQIQTIRNAIVARKQIFNFMGKDIKLRQGVAIFSTMNPIYLKRSKLTENIKSYFRTITVSMPDHETILEIMLYGLKFLKPRELSIKIGTAFSNLSIQLSKNPQYDFGLRAMKFLVSNLSKRIQQSNNQNQIVTKAFYDIFYYRLSPGDKPIFEKVISDIFKSTNPINSANITIESRVTQMKQSSQTGIIVFGPLSIKSTLIKKYCSSFTDSEIYLYNSNSTDMKYFLGQLIHGRWQQGIVEKVARQSLSQSNKMHLLVLDSILKSEIIQNFNTLLDQSKLLTLSNGTRLKVHQNLKLIMQTPHLNLASPSTITRCSILYVCDRDVDKTSLIQAQLPQGLQKNEASKKIKKILQKLNNNEIRQIGKLNRIIALEKYEKSKDNWMDNQVLGVEKAIVFAARVLGLDSKIQQFIQKQNSFNAKKSPFHHILAYQRYSEGQFLQISRTYEPIIDYFKFTLKTSQQIFMKWLVKRASSRQMQPILWKGSSFTGKSKGLQFCLKSQKYFKVSLTNDMESAVLSRLLLPQILDKKVQQIKQKPDLIIYIQNLNMANEQMSQQIRFMMEHNKIFSPQAREAVPIQAMAFVAQSRNFDNKNFDRVRRHFSQIQLPSCDQVQLKNIYSSLLTHYIAVTDIDESVKNLIGIQSQRFCIFLARIYQKRCETKPIQKTVGPYFMERVLKRCYHLTSQNCKQVSDFIAFMFEAIKLQDQFSTEQPMPESINLTYHQQYKGKFVKQYEAYLKNNNILFEASVGTTQSQSPRRQRKPENKILQKLIIEYGDKYCISQFTKDQIQIILRILESNQSHCCLIGAEGSGKSSIFYLACKIGQLNYVALSDDILEKQIKKVYFSALKKAFESKSKQIIIIDTKQPSHIKFLQFAQSVAIGTSVLTLFESQDTDYMFASITEFADDYVKTSKSYEQVCEDYTQIANQNIQLLIESNDTTDFDGMLQAFPCLYKRMYLRRMQQFPVQSLVQSIASTLTKSQKQSQQMQIQNLPRLFMKVHKVLYSLSIKNKTNNLLHFSYNQFHTFKLVQLFCREYYKSLGHIKQSEDIMNRSITKVGEISKMLTKLNQDIVLMQPQVQTKRNRILQVVPMLEDKKRKIQSMKYLVESQRREIDLKRQQLETLMKEVQQQIAEATPLLNDAIESIQTIKRNELSEIKNNMNPHPLIKFTMENMIILLGESDNWDNVRKILSDANLLSRIKNCQPTQQAYVRVKKRVQDNPDWTFDSVSKISFGARYLFKWIKSVIKYKDLDQEIGKKRQYVDKLRASLLSSEQKANMKMVQLQEKQKDSVQVEREYSKITKELNDLEELMHINKRKLINAQKIKVNLQQNFVKWEQKLKSLKQIKNHLTAHTVLKSLEISVFPALTSEQSSQTKKQLLKIFTQEALSLPKEMSLLQDIINNSLSNSLIAQLTHQDRKDPKKILLAYHFDEKPIIVDPDNQASNWLSSLNLQKRILYTKKVFVGASKTVEQAMKYGQILGVIIDNELDSFCTEILKSLAACSASNRNLIQYNKNTFIMNPQFRLLFFVKSKTPFIPVSISLKHQVINFQITKLSLHKFLLQSSLKSQNPTLSAIKSTIDETVQQISNQIQKTQVNIIECLMNNKKSLIEDEQFIQMLENSRSKTAILANNRKMQEKHITEIQIFYSQFQPVCSQAANIFISLKDMSKISQSLVWDVQIFIQYFLQACLYSISEVLKQEQDNLQIMGSNALGAFQFQQYNQVSSRPGTALSNLSLSMSRIGTEQNSEQPGDEILLVSGRSSMQQNDQHRIIRQTSVKQQAQVQSKPIFNVTTLITNQEQKGTVNAVRFRKIIDNLLDYLKKGFTQTQRYIWALFLTLKQQKKQDIKVLINSIANANRKRTLQTLIDQNMLTEGIKSYFSKFETEVYYQQAARVLAQQKQKQKQNKPQELTSTQKLILTQITAPQNFLSKIHASIKYKNYHKILEYEQLKVTDWLEYSDSTHPILLMMGEDPIQMISQFLDRKKYKHATLVAIGEDQGKGLDLHIEKECRKQGIFIIHNLHIATTLISNLVRLLQQFRYRPPHKNFRLILISSLESTLPQQLTSVCHKHIISQPSGLKNKLFDLYHKSQSYIDHSNPIEHKLTYSLCLMHSIVNEMQKYGSICWNFTPSYSLNDFMSSIFVLRAICHKREQLEDYACNIDMDYIEKDIDRIKQNEQEEGNKEQSVDFVGLRYIIGETCYVGKMSDNVDRKKMRIIVQNHFNQDIFKQGYVCWQGSKLSDDPSQVIACINAIDEDSPRTCGLYEGALPSRQLTDNIFSKLSSLYFSNSNLFEYMLNLGKFSEIRPISHRLPFINEEIEQYNQAGVYHRRQQMLREIACDTRVFNLKAFQNPRQLFVAAKLEIAMKNNVPYDNVLLVWSLSARDGAYGISNLILQGANIKNGSLIPGYQQRDVLLYFTAVLKKKDKDPNKGKAAIPLYFSEQRGQSIDNYGENTNLLTEVYLDSKQPSENWIVRGTAFIVSS